MDNRDIFADKLDLTYKKEESLGELRSQLAKFVNYWYIFLISVIICLGASLIYIQYLPNEWAVNSKIIVEDNKDSPQKSLTNGVNADLASLFEVKSNADNEVKILKSRSLLKSVITALNLNTRIFKKDRFTKKEIFNDQPFLVTINNQNNDEKAAAYNVEVLDNNHYNIVDPKEGIHATGVFGNNVFLNDDSITLNKTKYFAATGNYEVTINSIKNEEKELAGSFFASLDDKQATVIDLQLNYRNPQRGEHILQTLMQIYLQNNLANKVRLADSTMKFIDRRLLLVGSQLSDVEKDLEQYKVNNQIADITAQGKELVEGEDQYQNKLNDNAVQLAVVNSMYKYVSTNDKPQQIPSSLITKDVAFGTAINTYNEMLQRREQLKASFVETSPVISNLDQQIQVARDALKNSLLNYRNSLQIAQGQLKKQNNVISDKIAEAPVKERAYLDYSRQQTLKQDLYLYLLQKREETAISQTATISSCRILDDAESDERPFEPKKSIICLIAAFIGLGLPITGLSVKEMLNIKIQNKGDIDKHTSVPLLGEISRSLNQQTLLTYYDPMSIVSEQIRAIRTNLKYVTDKGKSNVILFTSSMSGEGKSFISLNLASSIALSGKKVVLLELDLRKPRLLKSIGMDSDFGFTNYMISTEKMDTDLLVKQSTVNENFYLVSSGPIPPNPAELLMDDRLRILIEELRVKFDYVIIDTAPIGLVSDALIIEEYADITCFVLRQNYTYKSQLGIVNDLYRTKKVKQLYLVVNDIKLEKNALTGYGNGYRGYGYAMKEEEPSGFNSLLKRLRPVIR
ncbi:GumC family protein [Mucilaginibacter sp.]